MSDSGRHRSWRMMEGWTVNTFRFLNEHGKSTFVRFTWKPLLGVHSLLLDEANIIGGVDPDFHRRDLHEAIKRDRKSTRLNSSHVAISYAVFCLIKKKYTV